ncbi:MAG: hypothetical protein E6767_02150 [Dysgonomonas sp.]|nr:hypothetical protein [Dysgonomonas sp.]
MKLRVSFLFFIGFSLLGFSQYKEKKEDLVKYNTREMYNIFSQDVFDTISIYNNDSAINIFEKRINILGNYISGENEFSINYISYVILNFELLTGIESESDSQYIGKISPTESDIRRWKLWFNKNKEHLCWYREKEILYFKK